MFSDIPGRTVSLNVPGADTTPISPSLSTEDSASRDTSDTHDNEFVSGRDDSDEQPVDDDTNNSDEEEDDSDEGGIETESDKTDQVNDEATEESDKSNDEKDVSDEEEDEEEEEEEDEEEEEEEKDEEEEEKEVVGEEVEEKPEETDVDVVEDDTDEPGEVEDVEDVEEEEPEGVSRTSPDTIDAHLASLRNELEQLHKHTQTIDQQSELQDKDMVTLDITLDRMNDKLESACACANGRYNKDLNTCQVDVTEKMLRLVKAVVSKPTNTPDAARKQEAFARHAPAFVYSDPSVRASMVKPLAEKLFTVLLSGDGPMVNTRITAVQVPLSQRSRLSRRRRPSCCSGASPFQRAMQSLSTGCDQPCSCRSRNGPANNIPTYTLPSVSPTSLSSSPAQSASPVWIVRSIPSAISSFAMPSSASVSTSSRARRRSFKNKSKSNRKRVSTKMSKSKSKSNRRSSATSSSVARKPSRSPGRSTTTKRKRRASQRGGSIRAHSRMIPAAGTVPNVRYVMDAQGSAPVAMTPAVQGGQTFVFPATATPACAVPTMYPATMTANTVPTAIQQTGGGNGNGSRPLMDVQGQYGCTSAAQQGGQVMVFPTTATPVCAVPGQCGGPVGVRGGGGRRRRGARRSRRFKT